MPVLTPPSSPAARRLSTLFLPFNAFTHLHRDPVPIARLSAESYKERKANNSQTLIFVLAPKDTQRLQPRPGLQWFRRRSATASRSFPQTGELARAWAARKRQLMDAVQGVEFCA